MAYDKAEILEQAIAAIKKNELTTMKEVLFYIPVKKTIVYSPEWETEFLNPIKEELETMAVNLKHKMKKKWRNSRQPILQIAAFKLMADDEELAALAPPRQQAATKGTGDYEVTFNL